MRKKLLAGLAVFVLVAMPVVAATGLAQFYGLTSNGSTDWKPLQGGLYVFSIYAPAAENKDGTCPGGGAWDTAQATVEWSPDKGTTVFDVDVAALRQAQADVNAAIQVGRGGSYRVTIASAGASTCLNATFGQSEGK